MSRIAWLHCFAGISGDTALGALVDAGADLAEVDRLVRRMPLDGWSFTAEQVTRAGLGATRVIVHSPTDTTVVRTYAHIQGLIAEARLPDRLRQRAESAILVLAETEAALLRRPIPQVHFHEVGGVAAIVGIIGTCAALEVLDVGELTASPVAQGHGTTRSDGHTHLNPAPATMAMLAHRHAPTYGRDLPIELTTPAGAAILAGLASDFGPMPGMTPDAIGYGAGERDFDGLPNVVQAVIGVRTVAEAGTHHLVLLEANVDDVTGEVLSHTIGALLNGGAVDAWCTPILMKRGRPGHKVSALCDPVLVEQVGHVLLMETGSSGLRTTAVGRRAGTRRFDEVDVDGYPVRIKVGPGRAKAEFEDAARVARRTDLPVREVISRAEAAWQQQRLRDAGSDEPQPLPSPPAHLTSVHQLPRSEEPDVPQPGSDESDEGPDDDDPGPIPA